MDHGPLSQNTEQWKCLFFKRIVERNRRQADPFEPILSAYHEYLREFIWTSPHDGKDGPPRDRSLTDMGPSRDTTTEVLHLQAELRRSYRMLTSQSEEISSLKTKIDEMEKVQGEGEIRMQSSLTEKTKEINSLENAMKDLEVQIRLLNSERTELKAGNQQLQSTLMTKTLENDRLLDDLLRFKEQEAGRLNEIQSLFNNLRIENQEVIEQDPNVPFHSSQNSVDRTTTSTSTNVDESESLIGSYNAPQVQDYLHTGPAGFRRRTAAVEPEMSGHTFGVLPGAIRLSQKAHDGPVHALAAQDTVLASGGEDGFLTLMDLHTTKIHYSFLASASRCAIYSLDLTKDQRSCLTACADQTLYVHNVASQHTLATLKSHTGRITGCGFRSTSISSGLRCFSVSLDRSVRLWDIHRSSCIKVNYAGSAITASATSPDSEFLVTGHHDGSLTVWNLRSEALPLVSNVPRFHDDIITGLTFSLDGTLVAAQTRDSCVKLFDFRKGAELRSFTAPAFRTSTANSRPCFSPTASSVPPTLVAASAHFLAVWDTARGPLLSSLVTISPTTQLLWYPSHLLSGHRDGTVLLWDNKRTQSI